MWYTFDKEQTYLASASEILFNFCVRLQLMSVTRMGIFWKLSETIFSAIVAKIFAALLGYLKTIIFK